MKVHAASIIFMATSANAFSTTKRATFTPRSNSAILNLSGEDLIGNEFKPAIASAALMAATLIPEAANAAGPDWGLFEGKTGSLLHPVIMGSMFLLSCTTALKGFQYKRQRTLGDEITALKKTLPNLGGAGSLKDAIAEAESAEDAALAKKLKAALPIQSDIDALVAERKELSKQNLRDSHWNQGAILAFMGTAFAIEGRK
jgi:hypothetical protein